MHRVGHAQTPTMLRYIPEAIGHTLMAIRRLFGDGLQATTIVEESGSADIGA